MRRGTPPSAHKHDRELIAGKPFVAREHKRSGGQFCAAPSAAAPYDSAAGGGRTAREKPVRRGTLVFFRLIGPFRHIINGR